MSIKPLPFLVPILCLCPLVIGCSQPQPEGTTAVRPIKIHTVGSLRPSSIREYPGTIRAYQTAQMGFEVAGRVMEFPVREGDELAEGDVLARLDARDYEAEFNVAEANLAKAQADLARSENTNKALPGAVSKDTLESDIRSTKVFEAKLAIAQKAVDDTVLRAPFDGIMARKLVEDFANVQAKEPVLIFQDNSVLEIEVAVPERDFVRRMSNVETREQLTERLSPKVIISSLPGREFPAVIKEYATTADPVTRTFAVKLNFDNPDDVNVLPGMTARVRIVVDPQSAWSVPVTAAQADENEQPYVWKIDPASMTVTKSPVQLGEMSGDRVLLTGGVEQGDQVAVSGVASLREGMQVRRMAEPGAAPQDATKPETPLPKPAEKVDADEDATSPEAAEQDAAKEGAAAQ